LVETDVVREEESDQLLGVLQRLHSFLDVRGDLLQDRAIPFGGHERLEPPDELIQGELPDPNAVEVVEAFLVPLAAGALDLLDLPYADDVVHREDLLLSARRPSEKGEVVRSEEHTSELQSRFDLVCR